MEKNKKNESEYSKQLKLSLINLLGETPNFIALLISALTTRAVLVFVDLIDTASNLMRNILVVFISKRLKKDLRFQYNYGVGKIEALSSMLCDFVMILSLIVMMFFAVKDLITPRAVESAGAMIFVIAVKLANVSGDVFIYWRQHKICKNSDSLVLKSALSVALKNLVFDLTSFTALILMAIFGNRKFIWYLSPIVSIFLGSYLIFVTVTRLAGTISIMLDRSAKEETQVVILRALAAFYNRYDTVNNVRSRLSGGVVMIDLDLGFKPETTYEEIQLLANDISSEISSKIPKCEISICINGKTEI